MAKWIDRKEAAKKRRSPGITPKSEIRAIKAQADNMSDLRRKGEKVPDHTEMFDEAGLKEIKAKVAKQAKERKASEKKAKAEATDHSKDFGADDEPK